MVLEICIYPGFIYPVKNAVAIWDSNTLWSFKQTVIVQEKWMLLMKEHVLHGQIFWLPWVQMGLFLAPALSWAWVGMLKLCGGERNGR